jgi:hypothetical protein
VSDRKRSRLEEEVESILAKADRTPPVTAKARSWGRKLRGQILTVRTQIGWLDSAWGWFGIALMLFVVGALVTGDSGLARRVFQYAGLAAVVIGVVRLIKPSSRQGRKTWRGREIDMRRPGVELGDKFDEWRKRR